MNKYRTYLLETISRLTPLDEREANDIALLSDAIQSDRDLVRGSVKHLPDPHLVSYFVPVDEVRRQTLLIHHVKSGLLLPPGGHVEPGEHPDETVERECLEELGLKAEFNTVVRRQPLLITATATKTMKDTVPSHTDISLWYLVSVPVNTHLTYEAGAIAGGVWMSFDDVASLDATTSDPEINRFGRKLLEVYP
jgi:8-oxo-dGTP diphosphatase